MMSTGTRRAAVPTACAAAVSAGGAVAINLATEWKSNVWAWVAVTALTAVAAVLSLWIVRRSQPPAFLPGAPPRTSSTSVDARGAQGVQIGDHNIQNLRIGDGDSS
jgi:hypothetical protein